MFYEIKKSWEFKNDTLKPKIYMYENGIVYLSKYDDIYLVNLEDDVATFINKKDIKKIKNVKEITYSNYFYNLKWIFDYFLKKEDICNDFSFNIKKINLNKKEEYSLEYVTHEIIVNKKEKNKVIFEYPKEKINYAFKLIQKFIDECDLKKIIINKAPINDFIDLFYKIVKNDKIELELDEENYENIQLLQIKISL